MKKTQIKVGKTYVNKGAGRTKRKVLDLSKNIKPPWCGSNAPPDEPGILYEQIGGLFSGRGKLYLSSFAAWAGREETK